MAWTAPVLRFTGDIITAAQWNEANYHALRYLKGIDTAPDGTIVFEDDITFPGAQTVDGRDVSADGTLLDAHKARHEPAGADEVNDIDIGNTGVLLSAHAARHENAGADEISVLGLSGLLADGQTPIVHSVAEHTDITRTLYVPFQHSTDGSGAVGGAYFGGQILNAPAEVGFATFQIPNDYSSLGTVIMGIIPLTTGDFDWTVDAEELDNGEAILTDTDSDTANAQAVVNITLLELDITAALDGLTLAKGDWVGVRFTLDGLNVTTTLLLIGISFGYTAEQ